MVWLSSMQAEGVVMREMVSQKKGDFVRQKQGKQSHPPANRLFLLRPVDYELQDNTRKTRSRPLAYLLLDYPHQLINDFAQVVDIWSACPLKNEVPESVPAVLGFPKLNDIPQIEVNL
jgi:hypothetical protein